MHNEKRFLKIGIDEAGRGPWFGPVVACACAFHPGNPIVHEILSSIQDSKKISEKKRASIFQALIQLAGEQKIFFGIGVVDNEYIDEKGIIKATHEAMRRALKEILRKIPENCEVHSILIDGNDHFTFPELLEKEPISIIRGDAKVKEIGSASIIAKVFRDELMKTHAMLYPDLGIASHKGYGTEKHKISLSQKQLTSFHRLSFSPVKQIMEKKPRLLLHVCCGPDATVPILDLKEKYDILAFWYDPNIHPKAEYEKRKEAFAHVCAIEGIEWVEGAYDTGNFFQKIRGMEKTPERGEKCHACYDMRLEVSAKLAKESGIDIFTTSLLMSPHKDMKKIFTLGDTYASIYGLHFLKTAFRKNHGFDRSVAYTTKHTIYRQKYCGCVFSDTYPQGNMNSGT